MWTRCSVAVEDYAIEYIQSHFKGLGNAFDELVGFLTYMKNTPRLRNLFFVLAGERGDPAFYAPSSGTHLSNL